METNHQPSWNGDVWINDNWTDEEKAQTLRQLTQSETHHRSTQAETKETEKRQQAMYLFRRNAGTNWNVFYEQNQNKFFKDRHYLHKAFPVEFAWLYPDYESAYDEDDIECSNVADSSAIDYSCTSQQSLEYWSKQDTVHVVEIGCGVGNAILPLLEQHTRITQQNREQGHTNNTELPQLHIHCLDFAPNAIQILKEDERFGAAAVDGRATANVYDLSSMNPSTVLISRSNECSDLTVGRKQTLANSADIAMLLFCLSAIGPHPSLALSRAAQHVIDMLKPGGVLIVRDYGRLDEAQLKLSKGNKELGGNFYQKGDGTGCYYFELDDLKSLFCNDNTIGGCNEKLNLLELDYIQRVYRNRGDGTTRRRVWVQGRFQKPWDRLEKTCIRESALLLQDFFSTSCRRWDDYYKLQSRMQQMTLKEAMLSKHSNNLLQLFPGEFNPWRSLLGSSRIQQKNQAASNSSRSSVTLIDVGCGTGNGTLLNIMAKQQILAELSTDEIEDNMSGSSADCPKLISHFIDFSSEAIQQLRTDPRYKCVASDSGITSTVLDVTTSPSAALETLNSDFVLLLFTLSAMGPYQYQNSHQQLSVLRCALKNVGNMLKRGGLVLFRDFGRFDDDQLQLNSSFGSQICANFYFRDDGTRTAVYFFDLEVVRELFTSAGFEVLQLEYITRPYSKSGKSSRDLSVNGGAVKRTRIWVHGRFRKK
jgi:SAM-dependent methyltransferase